MKQKLIFLDIDGTLLPPGEMLIPQSTVEALHKAHANGHKLFLCTGRNLRMTQPLLDYGFADQAKDMWRCALAAVIMGAAVAALNLLNIPDAAKLVIQIITGAAVYVSACAALKVESFTYVLNMLKKHKDAKKASSPDAE